MEDSALTITCSLPWPKASAALPSTTGPTPTFTPAGGTVSVSCDTVGNDIRVTVADSGPGIPVEQRGNIFDRYWQARVSDFEGSGLGLFIAKGIVEAHGGSLWIDEQAGPGATFVCTLPQGGQMRAEAPLDG